MTQPNFSAPRDRVELTPEQESTWRRICALLGAGEMAEAYRLAVPLNQELLDTGVTEFPALYEELLSGLAVWKFADKNAEVAA